MSENLFLHSQMTLIEVSHCVSGQADPSWHTLTHRCPHFFYLRHFCLHSEVTESQFPSWHTMSQKWPQGNGLPHDFPQLASFWKQLTFSTMDFPHRQGLATYCLQGGHSSVWQFKLQACPHNLDWTITFCGNRVPRTQEFWCHKAMALSK